MPATYQSMLIVGRGSPSLLREITVAASICTINGLKKIYIRGCRMSGGEYNELFCKLFLELSNVMKAKPGAGIDACFLKWAGMGSVMFICDLYK